MLNGKSVENPPQALIMYELCSKFKCMPDEIKRQDNRDIQELLIVHNVVNEHEAKQDKKGRRKEAIDKFGTGGGR